MTPHNLVLEATMLPVEDRAVLVEALLKSLNQPNANHDLLWAQEAESRLKSLHDGRSQSIDGQEVFKKLMQRFSV